MSKSKSTTRSRQRICLFDIEATNLDADFGHVVCISAKIYGEKKIHTFSTLQDRKPGRKWAFWDDSKVLKKWRDFVSTCDCLVGHYIDRFDKPYLNARMVKNGLPPNPQLPSIDTWRIARFNMKLSRNTLANVGEFLGVVDKKLYVPNETWVKIRQGDLRATREAERRCQSDVVLLERIYERLLPLIYNHPAMNEDYPVFNNGRGRFFNDKCSKCGKTGGLISDGRKPTQGGKVIKQRLLCKKCGCYSYHGRYNCNTNGIMGKP